MFCRVPARDLTTWYLDDRTARVFGTRDPARHLERCAVCRRIVERLARYVAIRAEVAADPTGGLPDAELLDRAIASLPPRGTNDPRPAELRARSRPRRRWWHGRRPG